MVFMSSAPKASSAFGSSSKCDACTSNANRSSSVLVIRAWRAAMRLLAALPSVARRAWHFPPLLSR